MMSWRRNILSFIGIPLPTAILGINVFDTSAIETVYFNHLYIIIDAGKLRKT